MKKILLFTDDKKLFQEIPPILIESGYSVDTFLNLSLSLKKITEIIYDIIIVDIKSAIMFEIDLITFIKHTQVVMDDDKIISLSDLPDYLNISSHVLALPEPHQNIQTKSTITDVTKEYIKSVLSEFDGNRTKTAQKLGISRTSLWRKIKQYNLNS